MGTGHGARVAEKHRARRRTGYNGGALTACWRRQPADRPIQRPTMHPTLTIAVKAARRAGNFINRSARDLDLLTITTKGPKDFVSEVDRTAEATIVETILDAYPDHAILAEEGTAKGANADAENLWIIDPLDGTTNFLHGFPQYCVSIGLQHRGQITQAVIYDPVRNDLFTATRGRGAFLNDRRIRVSKRDHLRDCLIGTGFPFRDGSYLDTYLRMMKAMIEQTAGLRRPGAAALDLAYVAAGFYDGFWEVGLNPWDVAAGSLLVQEAGGLIGDLSGEGDFLHGGQVIAANPKVFAQMVTALAPFRAELTRKRPPKPVDPAP
jgi:myo-inositol-1(or 4)-monophosphatase